jgi:hypothetical protein
MWSLCHSSFRRGENLGNFMRTLAMPKAAEPWSLTSLREKLIKIGAKVVSHGRYRFGFPWHSSRSNLVTMDAQNLEIGAHQARGSGEC